MLVSQITGLRQAQRAVLDIFSSFTKCAVGLYEPTGNGYVKEVLSAGQFESYCMTVRNLPEGDRQCENDHMARAQQAIESGVGDLGLCHAGLFNQALPIAVGGKVRAILMYGQMWVEKEARSTEARKRHEEVIERLHPKEDDEIKLRVYYDEVKCFSKQDLKLLNEQSSLLQQFFYGMLSDELELDRHTETVVHDLQTRLQPALAQAENLYLGLCQLRNKGCLNEELVAAAKRLEENILTMRVSIWNLGRFMPQYQFESGTLKGLIEEAVVLYRAEAERKEVDIRVRLSGSSSIEMSRVHLQHAINNLLHNAIKYSFSGRYDLERYVEIVGEAHPLDYVLTFSNYGVGILPEEFDLIFEPGYKGRLTGEEYRSGSGMGLAITKEIIEKHHGMIEVESFETGGKAHINKFIVRLPRAQLMSS